MEKDSKNNDDFEEIIDEDFIQSDNPIKEEDEILETYKTSFNLGDIFIIIFDDGKNGIYDILVSISSISDDDKKIYLEDEENNTSFISFINQDEILLKTDDYKILTIEKVEEFDFKNLDNENFVITKDIYPEVSIVVEQVKSKKYSIQEKKESLITELISIFKAYNDENKIFEINDIVDNLIKIYQTDKIEDYSNTLYFIKNLIKYNKINFPKWIIPIIQNKKILYKTDEEDKTESIDTINKIFEEELTEKYELFSPENISSNTYKKIMAIQENYSPFKNSNYILIEHDGLYVRHCNELSPCSGLISDITLDINNTRKALKIPITNNNKTTFETIYPNESVSLSGMYALPYNLYDLFFKTNDILSLTELYFLSHFKYSYKTIKERLDLKKSSPHTIKNNSEKLFDITNIDGKYIHSFILEKNIDNLGTSLKNNFFTNDDIINAVPDEIKSNIYNIDDFNKVYLPYELSFNNLDPKNKQIIIELISKNINMFIKNYNKSVKRKAIKNIPKKTKSLSLSERSSLALNYIMNIHVISLKNNYLKRFISTFSRDPIKGENKNYLYEMKSNKKILCKHYLYSILTHKDNTAFDTLKTLYGDSPEDGIIKCKVCGEYICHEDFSSLEGFSDGAPKQSNEKLNQEDDTKLLNEKQLDIKKKIQKISTIIGVDLNNQDKQNIIDFFDSVNDELIINHRYNGTNAFQKHPEVAKIKKKYPIVKSPKTIEQKSKNKKNNQLIKNELTKLKKFMVDSNELLIISFLILFHLQTSIPPYPFNSKINLNLWDINSLNQSWDIFKVSMSDNISIKTIETLVLIIKKIITIHKKNTFWLNIQKLLSESSVHKTLPNFNLNFLNISSYILQNQNIQLKLKNYYLLKNDISVVYLKESWPSYKPMKDNKIVNNINSKINEESKDYLLRNGSTILYNNISSIVSIDQAYKYPRFIQLNIPYSEIMKNQSFERLFNYSIHLHGYSSESPLINNLLNNFLNTITDMKVNEMIMKLGWNSANKSLKKIDFADFKKIFVVDITEHFKQINKNDTNTINTYIHLSINNWNGRLLNGTPKRNYIYTFPNVYPNESYEELLNIPLVFEKKENMVNKLFEKYCMDDDGNIVDKVSDDNFIYNLVAHPDIEKEVLCFDSIPKNKENFYKILLHQNKINSLKIINKKKIIPNIIYEKKLLDFINHNKLYKENTSFKDLKDVILGDYEYKIKEKEFSKIFNLIYENIYQKIETIQSFIDQTKKDDLFDSKQTNRFKSNFRRTTDTMNVMLTKMIDSDINFDIFIHQIFNIVGKLSNINNDLSMIPKQWKLSETNQTNLELFIHKNIFMIHNDIFIPESNDPGFYKYNQTSNYHLCFKGLFSYLKSFFDGKLDLLNGNNNSLFTEEYSQIFKKYIFITILQKLTDYIAMLSDETSTVSKEANEIFLSLEEQYQLNITDSIKICSTFTFDLLLNILEEFSDSGWIFNSSSLNDKISKQKEREKQNLITELESKDSDSRLVSVQQQTYGLTNWFGNADKKNLDYVNSEGYRNKLNDERSDMIKELFFENENVLEALESKGVNTENLNLTITEDQDEGYSQYDQDREDEGSDGEDNDGDYKES